MQLTDITNFLGFTDTKSKEPNPAANPVFDPEKMGEKEDLYSWEAPLRTQLKGFGGHLKKNLLIIAMVMGLFLLLIGEYFIILVVASVVFIGYILTATPPENVKYEITSHGINYVGQFYYWNELGNFFLTQDNGVPVLNIDVKDKIPARLFITLKEGDEEKPESFMDKAYKKITDKLDL